MKTIITLTDTFNSHKISSHRTVGAAVASRARHSRAWARANGPGSYITYSITASDGADISDEICAEEFALASR